MLSEFYRYGLIISFYLLFGGFLHVSTGADSGKVDADAELQKLNSKLLTLVMTVRDNTDRQSDLRQITTIIERLNQILNTTDASDRVQSDSYYIIGVYYLLSGNSSSSVNSFKKSIAIRESINVNDLRTCRAWYNMGVAYRQLGDLFNTIESQLRAIEITSVLLGKESIELLDPLASLSSAYIDTQQNEKSISCLNSALLIAGIKPDSVSAETLGHLYSNLGVSYSRLADFLKARLYFEKSLAVYHSGKIIKGVNYINLLNSLAGIYDYLGSYELSEEYYARGVELSLTMKENSNLNINIINSYAIILGKKGNNKKGEELLFHMLNKTIVDSVINPQLYFEALYNYGEYLRDYKIDTKKSLACLTECMNYLDKHPDDLMLKQKISIGYALTLSVNGEALKAIEVIQNYISDHYDIEYLKNSFHNPEITSLKPEKISLRLFISKYNILKSLYKEKKDIKYLNASAETSELVVALLEKMRINISEEDSRLILGDKYRDAYFYAIGDYHQLYRITGDKKNLAKAFEYSEKSKVAGLLASARELKATQFQIPADIAEYEFRLKNEIGLLNARIDVENFKEKPNSGLITIFNEKLLNITRLRDSLIQMFENDFPEYYAMKYNTRVTSMYNINKITGRNSNYINYILSDTVLYIFVANRKNKELIASPVNASFFDDIRKFRELLSVPGNADDAFSEYKDYISTGNKLFKILIEPIVPLLVSDKLIISPDNILAYIPFETLPIGNFCNTRPIYRGIPYMMTEFDISYTYSATFMSESVKRGRGFRNSVLAFAPNYPEDIDIQSVPLSRQGEGGVLKDLPFARQEAKFVTDITGGKLLENNQARESSFKRESGNYDILHLAMHTILNDYDPMHSTLIFSPEADTLEDRYLNTYEVYGIPLKAKMVVLSSCNTGSGFLSTGEGILSLARGFTYSGSQSVVMSMWEIEDRSGTEIVKMFYENIKNGYTKSASLRRARIEYLKNSDQLRSHPYFWSALIVYGNNDPLYYPGMIIWLTALFCVILLTAAVYLRRRRYS